ncbi:helix-turn-helix domain-containing protein [Vibrio parahaemolyticus]|nr:helix-turn-helix domain-containing protein [Vibrio parahaemolyticus]EIT7131606.1 helix-turn-helix domain-containing protein [Vibrio parahaemolyticus]EIZ1368490.1 helix-turn-helix domain-containing protein [Vibrio parahaemolyticus]EIZ4252101.1 helix-turn-helix domain-containing protein [Vibrio parahaemolyticus]
MNDSDINRFKVIQDVFDRRIRRVDAADILDLSVRQVQRLMNRLREFGAVGLTHQARGKPSNNRYPSDYRDTVLKLIRDHYFRGEVICKHETHPLCHNQTGSDDHLMLTNNERSIYTKSAKRSNA